MHIDGWANDTILMVSTDWTTGKWSKDTLLAKNGVVTYDSPNEKDTLTITLCALKSTIKRQGFPLFTNATTVKTVIYGDSYEQIDGVLVRNSRVEYKSKGSLPIFKQSANLHIQQLDIKESKDANEQLVESTFEQKYFDIRGKFNTQLRAIETAYIRDNPKSMLSGRLVANSRLADVISNYNLLDEQVKSGLYSAPIRETIKAAQDYNRIKANKVKIQVGKLAPHFKLKSLDGSMVTLESFKGKWVLLDFWGSWCGWCIKDFPRLETIYNGYKSKLEVVGIACNDTDEQWRKAVEKHKLPWANLLSDGEVEIEYAIVAYPSKILINPQGEISLMDNDDSSTFYDELSKILN